MATLDVLCLIRCVSRNDEPTAPGADAPMVRKWTLNLATALCLLLAWTLSAEPAWAQAMPDAPGKPTLPLTGLKAKSEPSSKSGSTADRYTLGIVVNPLDAAAADLAAIINSGQETGPNGEVALRVLPIVGKGGTQDIKDLLTLSGADLAIAPTTVLGRMTSPSELDQIKSRLVYIAQLYSQELHLLATSDVHGLTDLAGKSVSIGEHGSWTEAVARDVFDLAKVKATEVNLETKSSLEAMRRGDVAATFILAGKPVESVAGIRPDDRLHLIPIPFLRPEEDIYLPTTLSQNDYPSLIEADNPVDTIAITGVLMAYDWRTGSPRYQLAQSFVQSLFSRFEEFQTQSVHPKWREVNLSTILPGWRRFGPAERWLKDAQAKAAAQGTSAPDLNRTGSLGPASDDNSRLFEEFLRWKKLNKAQ